MHSSFQAFLSECEAKSELCQYLGIFQKLVRLCKQIIAADRDGDWNLHVGTVDNVMNVFQEFGAINYLRYGSYYLEKIKKLEIEHPSLHQQFLKGFFVVKERAGSSFSAVAPDMKLEQTINRFSQGPRGHVLVGQSGDAEYIAELNLLFHEINAITNLLHQLTNAHLMDHLETTIQHDLRGRKGVIFDKNVRKLLDFINTRQNPFVVDGPKVYLHNIVTKQWLMKM